MKLKILERMALLHALPQEGSYINLKIVRELREDLSFNEEEQKRLGMKETDGRWAWSKEEEKDVKIGDKATDIIVKALKKLNETEQLTTDHMTVYEKFVKD